MIINKIKQLLSKKVIRFLISGGVNTAFGYCCFAVLMFFTGEKEISVTLNLIISIFFNYNMSSHFVFQDKSINLRKILKFYAVYFITYPLNLLHLYVTVDIFGWNVYLSQFTTLLYMPLINFILQKNFIFH